METITRYGIEGYLHPNGGGFVANTAMVKKSAYIGANAQVYGNARVCDNAQVYDNALVYGNAQVYGNALVYGNAQVYGNALVCGETKINGKGIMGMVFGCNFFTATVNEGFIQIGCYRKTLDEWLGITQKEAVAMGLPKSQYKYYKAFGEMLLKLGVK